MIIQRFYIDKYDWKVVVLYEVDNSSKNHVISTLEEMNAPNNVIRTAYDNISANKLNTGFIYSDTHRQISLIVIGKAESSAELLNTICHEANHLQSHIATKYGLDEKGESVCYLIGDIVKTMFYKFNKLICLK